MLKKNKTVDLRKKFEKKKSVVPQNKALQILEKINKQKTKNKVVGFSDFQSLDISSRRVFGYTKTLSKALGKMYREKFDPVRNAVLLKTIPLIAEEKKLRVEETEQIIEHYLCLLPKQNCGIRKITRVWMEEKNKNFLITSFLVTYYMDIKGCTITQINTALKRLVLFWDKDRTIKNNPKAITPITFLANPLDRINLDNYLFIENDQVFVSNLFIRGSAYEAEQEQFKKIYKSFFPFYDEEKSEEIYQINKVRLRNFLDSLITTKIHEDKDLCGYRFVFESVGGEEPLLQMYLSWLMKQKDTSYPKVVDITDYINWINFADIYIRKECGFINFWISNKIKERKNGSKK